ncbi:MAG: hypothetical protein AAGD86_13305, partial [Pseudomonadota bacterium]
AAVKQLGEVTASLRDTQAALADKARALASRDALLKQQNETVRSLERRLSSNAEIIKSANALADRHSVVPASAQRIAEQVQAMHARLRDYDSQCSQNDATVDRLGRSIAAVTEQAVTMRTELSAARQRLSEAETRASAERRNEAALASRLAAARDKLGRMQTDLLERDQVIASLRKRLQAASASPQRELPMAPAGPGEMPNWLLSAPDGDADDLKRIYGIGPVLERTLNELGVFHFQQIAGLSAADVAWLAAHINSFPDRIIRDRWVEQAQELVAA